MCTFRFGPISFLHIAPCLPPPPPLSLGVPFSGVLARGYIRLRISRVRHRGLRTSLSLVFLKFLFYLIFRSNLYILDYIVKSRRKGFELEPWFLPRFPARIFSLRGFFGQVFSGLRLTAFISVCKR